MVYVTGATGLIGSYLLLELSKRGKKIRAVKRKTSNLNSVKNLFIAFGASELFDKIDWVEVDLLDVINLSKSLEGIETIYHTAASVGFDERYRKEIHEINVTVTENLVNIAIDSDVKNIVYLSSISVLDKNPSNKIITENSGWDPQQIHSEYAISKKKGEMAVWRGSQEGLNVIVVYPSIVIGSLDGSRASENIFKLAHRKKAFASKGITGYVEVRDVVFCVAELVEKGHFNQSFLLNSEEKSFLEIFEFLRNRWGLGSTKVLTKRKLKFIKAISQISRIFGSRYLSQSSYLALIRKSKFSNQKIKDAIGIEFQSVEEALIFHGDRYLKMKQNTQ